MERESKDEYETAVATLRSRLDYGVRALAAQDFRHLRQEVNEKVGDFVRRLERTFKKAYGRDAMQQETRDMLLFAQLQEGLKLSLLEAPSVSGAVTYNALILAAKNEEKRQHEMKRRRSYINEQQGRRPQQSQEKRQSTKPEDKPAKSCWTCGKSGHLSKDCKEDTKKNKPPSKSGSGRIQRPSLKPIPVQRPFQIWGVDIMEMPVTASGNRYCIVFQDFLTKWPLVFAAPDQKSERIVRLLANELVPVFGVPEALLSDRGTNLLSTLMLDVCKLLGIKKLNTTSYHPQCDGMVERFNRSLKAMIRKHAAKFGPQWDTYLAGIQWAYRNTPHEATKEKPSYLMFGVDLRSPTDAAFIPPEPLTPADVSDYKEILVLSLSSARQLASDNIGSSQRKYKEYFDRKSRDPSYKIGDWVFVYFPHEATGKQRKISRPWHGPYQVVQRRDPDVSLTQVYFPEVPQIYIHQSRVCKCPPKLPIGFYWYGQKKQCSGHMPMWLQNLLKRAEHSAQSDQSDQSDQSGTGPQTCGHQFDDDVASEVEIPEDTPSKVEESNKEEHRSNSKYSLRPRVLCPNRLFEVKARDELPKRRE